MFKNNLKIAWRNLKKNKVYSAINIVGLSVGICAALLIFQILKYELSFNKGFSNYDKIVRVVTVTTTPNGEHYSVCLPIPAMEEVETSVPQFKKTSKVKEVWASLTISNPNGSAPIKKISPPDEEISFFAESSFFEIFDFEWLAGVADKSLDDVGSIVLTDEYAKMLFGSIDEAVGQTVLVDNLVPVSVKGVVKKLDNNVDFAIPFLISYKTLEANARLFYHESDWGSCSSNDQLYALMNDNTNIDDVNTSLLSIGQEQYGEQSSDGRSRKHVAQQLKDQHYSEDYATSGSHRISLRTLKILGLIGLLILIMACFNFINLATAQSILRTKEVGVRKTLGGKTKQLVRLFMTETSLIVGVSIALAIGLAFVAAPYLSQVSHVPSSLPFLSDPSTIIFLVISGVIVAFLAGLYPSITLASAQPSTALKNISDKGTTKDSVLRKILVVAQFSIAQVLIIGAVVTVLQMNFISEKDLGFTEDLVYTFEMSADDKTINRQGTLKNKLLQIPSVESVSLNSDVPLSGNTWSRSFRFNKNPENEKFHITEKFVDENYHETFGLNLIAGRWLEKSDTARDAIVNMTTISKLGLDNPNDVLGKSISRGDQEIEIVGVVEDFHTKTFHRGFEPLLMTSDRQYFWGVGIKIKPTNISSTLSQIQTTFDQILPEQIMAGSFLDEGIARMYEDDQRMKTVCKAFGLLAILISCLGLFGLATHAASRRIKEIGIRKVFGAKAQGLVLLLSKDFIKLVLIAFAIATPIAYYFMDGWLSDFTYRINIEWWIFALTGFLAILIAFLSVGYQSLKAAFANPIKSLRSE